MKMLVLQQGMDRKRLNEQSWGTGGEGGGCRLEVYQSFCSSIPFGTFIDSYVPLEIEEIKKKKHCGIWRGIKSCIVQQCIFSRTQCTPLKSIYKCTTGGTRTLDWEPLMIDGEVFASNKQERNRRRRGGLACCIYTWHMPQQRWIGESVGGV